MSKTLRRRLVMTTAWATLALLATVWAGGLVPGAASDGAQADEPAAHPVSWTAAADSVSLNWTADPSIERWFVFWSLKDAASFEVGVTKISSYTISDLDAERTYTVRVQPLSDTPLEVLTSADSLPTLAQQAPTPCVTGTAGDYDLDNDGLIDICNLQQLDAIRHDLNGDGAPDLYPQRVGTCAVRQPRVSESCATGHKSLLTYDVHYGDYTDAERTTLHGQAFPGAVAGMGCPSSGCKGYELKANLDFDTNGNGVADSGDAYWNEGQGWRPIVGITLPPTNLSYFYWGGPPNDALWQMAFKRVKMFDAVFEGNGRTIDNLYINRRAFMAGLFGFAGPAAQIRNIGLLATNSDSGVQGTHWTGALVGSLNEGVVSGSYSHLPVSASHPSNHRSVLVTGGLIGVAFGRFWLVIESYASGDVNGFRSVGGLIGRMSDGRDHRQGLQASFASGDVSGRSHGVGGLVGDLGSWAIKSSYASGDVTLVGSLHDVAYAGLAGGLTGRVVNGGPRVANASYATGRVSNGRPDGESQAGDVLGGMIGAGFAYTDRRGPYQSYWDINTSGLTTSRAGVGKTTAELQAPTDYTGIYSGWPIFGWNWDFGTSEQYPILIFCDNKPGIELQEGVTSYCPLREVSQHGRTYGE